MGGFGGTPAGDAFCTAAAAGELPCNRDFKSRLVSIESLFCGFTGLAVADDPLSRLLLFFLSFCFLAQIQGKTAKNDTLSVFWKCRRLWQQLQRDRP